eukprot:c8926_g1_i3.p1 GENE.c8926_g1_i3~~c8926_g1_i3.p1  ORF type:complete len:355 (+),score=99.04 c8926_g1_i3:45-1109(+)
MGCVESTNSKGTAEDRSANSKITRELRAQYLQETRSRKLLLLGAGESGKSTFLKQMRLIYLGSYSEAEKIGYVKIIHSNIIDTMQTLLNQTLSRSGGKYPDDVKKYTTEILQLTPSASVLTKADFKAIRHAWRAPSIQATFAERSTFQLMDNANYFLERIEDVEAPNYIPTEQDILHSRIRTTGIVQLDLEIENVVFKMFDVGGQRNERRKWIHCFEGCDAVLFVVGLSEYDQQLLEDNNTNRMKEALTLFDEICNSRFFTQTSMILFLNKSDLFREKLERVSLAKCFPDYKGKNDFESAVDFVKFKFNELNLNATRPVFQHVTCATDTTNVRFVFESVRKTVIAQNLRASGLM